MLCSSRRERPRKRSGRSRKKQQNSHENYLERTDVYEQSDIEASERRDISCDLLVLLLLLDAGRIEAVACIGNMYHLAHGIVEHNIHHRRNPNCDSKQREIVQL